MMNEMSKMVEPKRLGGKGQMFLLSALVIVVVLVWLKFSISYPTAAEEMKTLEARFENKMFNNLINEMNNSLRFSYDNTTDMTRNVFDFANFSKPKIGEHSMLFKALFVGSVANSTTSMFNVSVVNVLNTEIDANITFDGLSDSNTIPNYGIWDTNFTITPGTEYTMTLRYGDTTEEIEIKTKKKKDVYVGYFFVSIEGESALHQTRFQNDIKMHLPRDKI